MRLRVNASYLSGEFLGIQIPKKLKDCDQIYFFWCGVEHVLESCLNEGSIYEAIGNELVIIELQLDDDVVLHVVSAEIDSGPISTSGHLHLLIR